MQNKPRRVVPAKHAAKVLGLICVSVWLFPIYEEGVKCLLSRVAGTAITSGNNELFSIGAFAIWVPIAFAWRRPKLGATVQFGFLAALLAWLAFYQPSVLKVWASYAIVLLAVCIGLWLLTFGGGIALALIEKRSAFER